MEKIDIRKYVKKDLGVLRDRPKGEQVRQQTNLEEKDKDENKYEVVIDNNFISLNTSFFLGMFEKSIQTLGETKFREKYQFRAKDVFMEKIDVCILTALVAGDDDDVSEV